jgi:BirA family biotin operon repressor/biotin-[acetyl-CoA-carboxylase] ligase
VLLLRKQGLFFNLLRNRYTATSIPGSFSVRVTQMPDRDDWDLERLAAGIWPATLIYLHETESTNDVALEECRVRGAQEEFLVLASHQRRGRGRGTNTWWSSSGALTFSWVPRASRLPPGELLLVPLTAGLAVLEALQERKPGAALSLKWPNDVLLNGRKIAGILTEATPPPATRLVIGIGINVNNSLQNAPPEIRRRATSCVDAWHMTIARVPLLLSILSEMDRWLEILRSDRQQFLDAWRVRCALSGREVEVEVGRQRIAGQCQGIDPDGALCVYTTTGVQRITAGTVCKAEGLLVD